MEYLNNSDVYKSYNIIYESVELTDIKQYGSDRFNSNNHWINEKKPDDYFTSIDKNNTKNWVDKLNRPYKKIIINDSHDIYFLNQLACLGKMTGKSSKIYEDELLVFVKKYEDIYSDIFTDNKKYFVRSENVSLKYGEHGLIPYTNFKTIVESIVTCPYGHTPIYSYTTEITLYLFDWLEMDTCDEFRIFVKNKKITCISQQYLYHKFDFTETMLKNKIRSIIDYFEDTVIGVVDQSDFSYDFTFVNSFPYFIEPNSYGKEYAAGSSLFHWLIDYDKLYGLSDNTIYVRYVI
jgi:hypothetical protein